MSIAVANWEKKDARKEIHQLVDNIRDKGFSVSKDLILKTFLYLYSTDIKFITIEKFLSILLYFNAYSF